jgi:hypothetical protein
MVYSYVTLWRLRVMFLHPPYPNSLIPFHSVLWRFNIAGNNKIYFGVHVKCPMFLPDFNQIWICSQIFIEIPNIKFHRNPFKGNGSDTCGQTDRQRDGRTDMTMNTLQIIQLPHPVPKRTQQNVYLFWSDCAAKASLDCSLRLGYGLNTSIAHLSVYLLKFGMCNLIKSWLIEA